MRMDGVLIVDKPEGMTSLDVVRELKVRFSVRKAGHIGTLDPFATGVLPVVVGEGTKLVPFLQEDPKDYEAVMKVGEETTTGDPTGEVTMRKSWDGLSPENIGSAMETFKGWVLQVPPMFSAVKIKGVPLYKMARKGIEIEREKKEVQIYELSIRKTELPLVHFRVSCSRGTYIRTLAKDIGVKIGCGAHLVSLKRTRSGPFHIGQAVSLETLKTLPNGEELRPYLIRPREALSGIPEVVGDARLVEKIRQGKGMLAGEIKAHPFPFIKKGGWVRFSSSEEGLVAVLRSEMEAIKFGASDSERVALRPVRVFQRS